MKTNLAATDLVHLDSAAPAPDLEALYQAIFVEKMRRHFQAMLTGAYAVYVTALGEGFDPALRAHLTDVLQDLIVKAPELADVFGEALLRNFQSTRGQASALAEQSGQTGQRAGALRFGGAFKREEDASLQEFLSKSARSLETQHGSVMLALTSSYVQLAGQSAEGFCAPWSPAVMFSAFDAVLEHIEMPIHSRVALVLYKTYAQEVLKHLGDACLALRDALPASAPQETVKLRSVQSGRPGVPHKEGLALPENRGEKLLAEHDGVADPGTPLSDAGSTSEATAASRASQKSVFILAALLLVGLAAAWGAWHFDLYARVAALKEALVEAAPGGVGSKAPSVPDH